MIAPQWARAGGRRRDPRRRGLNPRGPLGHWVLLAAAARRMTSSRRDSFYEKVTGR